MGGIWEFGDGTWRMPRPGPHLDQALENVSHFRGAFSPHSLGTCSPQEIGVAFALPQQLVRNAETWAPRYWLHENLYFSKICRGLSASMVWGEWFQTASNFWNWVYGDQSWVAGQVRAFIFKKLRNLNFRWKKLGTPLKTSLNRVFGSTKLGMKLWMGKMCIFCDKDFFFYYFVNSAYLYIFIYWR